MNLTLTRPIVFFDLETTGTNITQDRVVQISVLKLFPDQTEEAKTRLINPGIPIPPAATAIHGITDSDVAGEPLFKDLARSIADFFTGSDIGGFNSNRFDVPFLAEELARCGIDFPEANSHMIDVLTIFHRKEERTLAAAYKFYCGKTLENAHDAEADVRATLQVFKGQVAQYTDIGATTAEIHDFCNQGDVVDLARKLTTDDQGRIVYTFGKNKGKPVSTDPDYARWVLESDFPHTTKRVIKSILDKTREGK